MKRVLCILSGMNVGGAETFLMKIYRNIDKNRFQMDFCICEEGKNFYEDEILSMCGKIYTITPKSKNIARFKKELSEVVSQNHYKYVMRVTSTAMGFMDLMVAKKAGASVCIARSSNASDGGGIKATLAHKLGQVLYSKYVDVKIAPSDLAAKYTFGDKAYKSGDVEILNNAVDINLFSYAPQKREKIRREFGIDENAMVVGHVGRFAEQKNHSFLIDIFNEIKKKKTNAVLLLVGKGELEEQVHNQLRRLNLENSVIFAGVRSDVPDLLSAMDVFVFPSLYEGMPNTVIEAQANGLYCIISDTITKEADITGLVEYLSLSDSSKKWAEKALIVDTVRGDQTERFLKNRYDIDSVVQDFVKYVFQE